MRIFQAIQLCDADTGSLIQERRYDLSQIQYDEAGIEWWGMMAVSVYGPNGKQVAQKPVPFKINATNRTEAFQNMESSMHAASEAAKQQVQKDLDQAAQNNQRKIVIAAAADAVVAAGRRVQ